MAREKMVTRTINGTKAMVRVYNDDTELMEDVELVVSVKAEDAKLFDKKIRNAVSALGDEYTFVKVMETEAVSNLYAMPESVFIANAHIVDKSEAEDED